MNVVIPSGSEGPRELQCRVREILRFAQNDHFENGFVAPRSFV